MRTVLAALAGVAVGAFLAATSRQLRTALEEAAAQAAEVDPAEAATADKLRAMGVNVGGR